MFLYTSDKFGAFLNWTSLLVMGFANYTLPLSLTMAEVKGLIAFMLLAFHFLIYNRNLSRNTKLLATLKKR